MSSLMRRRLSGFGTSDSEGYVVRLAGEVDYSAFKQGFAKFVRKGHVQTVKHWMHGQRVVPNGLLDELALC